MGCPAARPANTCSSHLLPASAPTWPQGRMRAALASSRPGQGSRGSRRAPLRNSLLHLSSRARPYGARIRQGARRRFKLAPGAWLTSLVSYSLIRADSCHWRHSWGQACGWCCFTWPKGRPVAPPSWCRPAGRQLVGPRGRAQPAGCRPPICIIKYLARTTYLWPSESGSQLQIWPARQPISLDEPLTTCWAAAIRCAPGRSPATLLGARRPEERPRQVLAPYLALAWVALAHRLGRRSRSQLDVAPLHRADDGTFGPATEQQQQPTAPLFVEPRIRQD